MKIEEYHQIANEIWNSSCNSLDYYYGDGAYSNNSYNILGFYFGHIVWEDFNYESWHIKWCLDQQNNKEYDVLDTFEKQVLVNSLEMLLKDLPKYEECEDYEQFKGEQNG